MLASFIDTIRDGNAIAPQRMAGALGLPMTDLARLAHVNRNTLSSKPRLPSVQEGLGLVARIIARASELAGGDDRAILWFRHQPIAGFGGSTAEELVVAGHGRAVIDYLEALDAGSYA